MTPDLLGSADALRPGTILSFPFPLGTGTGRVKTRPCLVIARTAGADGAPRVTIAYGTSADTAANRGLDLDLADPAEWQAAGLHRPTRFVLSRRVTVPLTDAGLAGRRPGAPVIGTLPAPAAVILHRLTRALGAALTEDRRRGAVRAPAWRRPDRHPAPVIIRVARRRIDRLALAATQAPAPCTASRRCADAPARTAVGRRLLRLPRPC